MLDNDTYQAYNGSMAGINESHVNEIAALAPAEIAARLKNLSADIKRAYSANTVRSWRANWRIWSAYCRQAGQPVLPVELSTLRSFLEASIAAGKKRATLQQYLSTLAWVQRMARLPNPMDTPDGILMWRGLCAGTALTAAQRQAQPLRSSAIDAILKTLDETDVRDARDGALICVAYDTLMRRAELCAMQVTDVRQTGDAAGNFHVSVGRSKTDREGRGMLRYISKETAVRIERWKALSGVRSGMLWRAVRGQHVGKQPAPARFAKALQPAEVSRIYKRRATGALLEDGDRLSGHSTRVGAALDLRASGESTLEIQQAGGWKTAAMVVRYTEAIDTASGAMARLHARRQGTVTEIQKGSASEGR